MISPDPAAPRTLVVHGENPRSSDPKDALRWFQFYLELSVSLAAAPNPRLRAGTRWAEDRMRFWRNRLEALSGEVTAPPRLRVLAGFASES